VREVATTDYHTAGEPFRIVTEGAPPIPGATVAERRVAAAASEEVDGEVLGQAFRTGEHRFVLDPRDPVGVGFALR
jgi:proline racemase